jgi:non-specific serine/threonine protein kinase
LAALSDPSLVLQTVATAMGLLNTAGSPPLEPLTRYLAPKKTLLLLDNCEHLVAACADLANALLRVCPKLQILATSREGLKLAGETTWPVPSLSVPSLAGGPSTRSALVVLGQYESIQLFVERAKAVMPAFALNEQNIVSVARLCHRLDGIPLAIELAAARIRLLSVEQLVDRVKDRFRLLTGGSRTALPRQQTLRALVDWSYDLLSERERLLFDRLSVFIGGWTMESAEAVCADDGGESKTGAQSPADLIHSEDILDLIGHLLEKSMIVAERSVQGTPRFRLLETLRQYGQERLAKRGEVAAETLRARHARHFIALSEQVALGLRGPDQTKWSERLELEHDNLRAVLEWGKAADAPPDRVELALRLAGPLYAPWFRRGHGREGRQHFETLLSHRNAQLPTRARAQVLFAAGSLALWQDGDDTTALVLLNKSFSLAEQLGDTRVMADAGRNLGQALSKRGDLGAARRRHEEAIQLSRADGDLYGIRWSLENLAELAADEGDTRRASELCEEALSLARQTGDHHGIASILQTMGTLARATGKSERARELIGEGLSIMERIGCNHCSAWFLGDLAFVASASGESERAVQILGAADALRERTGTVVPTTSVATNEQTLGEARRRLGDARYAAAWKEGRAMSLPQATAYAIGTFPPVLSSS